MCRFGTSCRKQAQSAAALPKQLQQRPGMSWPTSGPKLRPILLPSGLLMYNETKTISKEIIKSKWKQMQDGNKTEK